MASANKNKTSAGKLYGFQTIYGAQDGKELPYMTRAWIGRLRFHLFWRGDQDPDCHDHPWGFWTFPLRSYVEEVLHERNRSAFVSKPVLLPDGNILDHEGFETKTYFEREVRIVKGWRFHRREATHKHRVLGVWRGLYHTKKYPSLSDHPLPGWEPRPEEGVIPTLVWRDHPTGRLWGFWKERVGQWCYVPWKEYIYGGGKHGPCE